MKVVDLADEFGLTTSEAIDACLWAGVAADSSATELTPDDTERVRNLISGWIDAGFAPWRGEGDIPPGAGPTNGGGAAAAVAAPARPAAARVGQAPASGDDARGDDEPTPREPPPVRPPGPVMPAASGQPTGWLPGGPDARPKTAALAFVALALAVLSLIIPFVPAVAAIILAVVAKDRIRDSRGWLKGESVAALAQVIAGIGIGLWIVLLAGNWYLANERDKTTSTDAQVDIATIAYEDAQVGDCVRLPKLGDISQWRRVSCDELHQAQIVGSTNAGNPANQAYPGRQPIEATATAACRRQLDNFVNGPPGSTSTLEVGFAYPSAASWKGGDRQIWCLAFPKDGTLVNESFKNNPPG